MHANTCGFVLGECLPNFSKKPGNDELLLAANQAANCRMKKSSRYCTVASCDHVFVTVLEIGMSICINLCIYVYVYILYTFGIYVEINPPTTVTFFRHFYRPFRGFFPTKVAFGRFGTFELLPSNVDI